MIVVYKGRWYNLRPSQRVVDITDMKFTDGRIVHFNSVNSDKFLDDSPRSLVKNVLRPIWCLGEVPVGTLGICLEHLAVGYTVVRLLSPLGLVQRVQFSFLLLAAISP